MSESDVLKIRYLRDNKAEVIAAMDEAGYGTEMRTTFNEFMFTPDPTNPNFEIFDMLVEANDENLKKVLAGYGAIFEVTIEPWKEPELSLEAEAAAIRRLRARGFTI